MVASAFVNNRLTAAMGMQVKVDPSPGGGPFVFGHMSRFHCHLDFCGAARFEDKGHFVTANIGCILRVGRAHKQSEHGIKHN